MGTISHLTASFFISLSLVGVSIYYFIEGDNLMGKVFVFIGIFVFISFFFIFRSIYYLRHKATFNEFIYVFILPLIPVLILFAQEMFNFNDIFLISTGNIKTNGIDYDFYITIIDFLLLPYYLASNYLLFRSFIRYPFIRFKSTSEKGMPPKLAGLILMLAIPALYIASSLTYFHNFFLLIFGIVYFYLGTVALFV